MIAGQSPRLTWRENVGGAKRSLADAIEIARTHGVSIPDDVDFFEVDENELPEHMTARGPVVSKPAGSIVVWSDFVNSVTGKIPFRIRTDVLSSDEAIVAVFGHEMYELTKLRAILKLGRINIEQCIDQTRPDNPGNLHDEAWDYADELVLRMRKSAE